jgi:alkylated DNA repair protein alkB family protein 7
MQVYEDFVTESEEKSLLKEVEPYLKRLRYETSHWDDAILGYREVEKSNWNETNGQTMTRVRGFVFPPSLVQLPHVHVLDLDKSGVIKPHIDSIKFCGRIIGGLSLLSSSVMRLVHEQNLDMTVDILLKRRSLYIMTGEARYKYTHSILGPSDSLFGDKPVPRERRVSVMFRCEPDPVDESV